MPDRFFLDQHVTCRWFDEPADDIQGGCLAATAGTEQREELAVANGEIDAVYGGNVLVVNTDRTEFDTRSVGRRSTGRSLMVRPLWCFGLQRQVLSSGQRRDTPWSLERSNRY
jgi:hypothetical protein